MSNRTQEEAPVSLHSVSVAGVVVRDDGSVLAIRRADNGAWEPPGGILELHESPEAGVIREVEEETGIHVAAERLTGIYKNVARGVVALVFLCRPLSDETRTSNESTAVEWLPQREAEARMSEVFAVRVRDALDDAAAPHVRTHDGRHVLDAADGNS